jgi:acetyl esterase/lipase
MDTVERNEPPINDGSSSESVSRFPANDLRWRPTSYQHRIDAELAAAEPFIVNQPLDRIEEARRINDEFALASMTSIETTGVLEKVTFVDREIPGEGGPSILVRVYSPKSRGPLSGTILYIHGGGFAIGNLDTEHVQCLHLANEVGCVVVSVDYRLAPEFPFPCGFNDCYDALRWITNHPNEIGSNSNTIAIVGRSAGGNLAAAISQKARDHDGPTIALQLLIYPVLDVRMKTSSMTEFHYTPVWDSKKNAIMWRLYLPQEGEWPQYASPALAADFEGLPPTVIQCAELDPLRDEALDYAGALMRRGVPVELHNYQGAYHAFDLTVPYAEISRRATAEVTRVLQRTMAHIL